MSENNNDNSSNDASRQQQPPAGWYPDPSNATGQRYWDGAQWTEHAAVPAGTAGAGGGAVAASAQRRLPKLKWWQWVLVALGALVVVSIIVNGVNSGRGSGDAASDDKPTTQAEQSDKTVVEEEPEITTVAVPALTGKTVAEARAAVEAAGFTLVVNAGAGEDWLILSQGPVGNQKAEPGTEVSVIAEVPKPVYTLAQQNAIDKAQSYLDFAGFSRTGLIDQLEYEGFSTEDATFGADSAGADWNAEAAEKAASYLEFTSFSRQGLYDQLAYEGFTDAEIQYALAAVGY